MDQQPLPAPGQPMPQPQPGMQPQQQYTNQAPAPQQPMQAPPPQKKRGKLWLWISLGVVLLLGIIGIGLFLLGYPAVQARATAVAFMDAVQKADEPAIKKLSGKETDPFIKNISTQLQGATYKIASTDRNKDGTYSVKFAVDKSASIKNATVVTKGSNVSKFYLNATSSTNANAASNSTDSKATPSIAKVGTDCITPADMNTLWNLDPEFSMQAIRGPISYIAIFFEPDSLDYSFPNIMDEEYDRHVKFLASPIIAGKDYTVHLKGSVFKDYTTDPGKSLAMQRSQKVKEDLIKHGLPESKIIVDLPERHEYGQEDDHAEIYRRVEIFIVVPDRCFTPGA